MGKEKEKDKCAVCGTETPYDIDTHVDLRLHYVGDGAPQLCAVCWVDTYGPCGCHECAVIVARLEADKNDFS